MGKGLDRKKLEELLTALRCSLPLAPYLPPLANDRAVSPRTRFHSPTALFPEPKREPEREQADPRLAAVAEALEALDQATSVKETVDLCSRTIIEQFQVEKMAYGLRDDSGGYPVTGVCGLPDAIGILPAEALGVFLQKTRTKKMVPYDARMQSALPALEAKRCCWLPLQSQDRLLGFFLVLDADVRKGDLMLLSMVAQAAAAKLLRIVTDAEQARKSAHSDRLMTLANTLLLVDNKEELYESILSIACDLVDAMQGSIMLSNVQTQAMEIAFTRGVSLEPSQSLPVKVGNGIAGLVAQSREPLLVDDIEKFGMPNRPRFKSRSLICIPLKLRETVIGVLNVSEKKNLTAFSNADLQLLNSFASLASVMIERTAVLEKSMRFEQLSVTDSLTGLYNRRFLKSRLEEELNRSMRHGLSLTLLFIDLDFFKSYNDVCGHIAGDKALRRTADIIKGSVREMDIVARYGGEEFCAVLPGTSKAEALLVAERIRCEIENEAFSCRGPFSRRITASLGVASFPEDGRSFTALVHASDVALYEAKAGGRNRVVAARPAATLIPSKQSVEMSSPELPPGKTSEQSA